MFLFDFETEVPSNFLDFMHYINVLTCVLLTLYFCDYICADFMVKMFELMRSCRDKLSRYRSALSCIRLSPIMNICTTRFLRQRVVRKLPAEAK